MSGSVPTAKMHNTLMSYKLWLVKLLSELAEIVATQQPNPLNKLVPALDPKAPNSSPASVTAQLLPELAF